MLAKFHQAILLSLLVLSVLVPSSFQQPAPLPPSVATLMANRAMRYHHYLFHNIRNNWNTYNSTVQAMIASYGWAPPRPAKDATGVPIKNNNAGEDFLYMHMSMINMFNRHIKASGAAPVTGFKTIPAANDAQFPMPANFTAPTQSLSSLVSYYKSEEYYVKLKAQEALLTNATFLKTLSLSDLGVYIEWTSDVHQGMHFRFGELNSLMRVKTREPIPYVDPKWDVVQNNWLIDVYGSHVNPWFWKLHGWINDRIFDWARANGLSKLSFKGTWTGGNMKTLPKEDNIPDDSQVRFLGDKPEKKAEEVEVEMNMDGMEMDHDMDMSGDAHPDMDPVTGMNMTAMEAVMKIVIDQGNECDYYSDLGNPNHDDMNGWN